MKKRSINLKRVNEIIDIEQLAATRHVRNVNELHEESRTLGEKISDKMAEFAGSWTFIIIFGSIIILWVLLNSLQLLLKPFDQFPFILLNLLLSCIAALQAPVIMMSQNRQEAKDRIRAEHDYEINLKAEIMIEEIFNRIKKIEENQVFIARQFEEEQKIK